MQSNLLRKISQVILAFFLILIIGGLVLTFVGIGFVGGVVLAAWESIEDVDLGQLEYRQADTWKQHQERIERIKVAGKIEAQEGSFEEFSNIERRLYQVTLKNEWFV